MISNERQKVMTLGTTRGVMTVGTQCLPLVTSIQGVFSWSSPLRLLLEVPLLVWPAWVQRMHLVYGWLCVRQLILP